MQILELDSIGTHLTLSIDTPHDCSILFGDVRERLALFEEKFSRFKSDNWLAHLNADRSGELDADARFMLLFALDVARKTDGYFDPTIGKRLTELGYGIGKRDTESKKENVSIGVIAANAGIPYLEPRFHDKHGMTKENYRDIEIIGDTVILHGNVELEFGGVGKGYLIDVIQAMIADFFEEKPHFLINFGGDMYGYGNWKVGLESPFAPDEAIGTYELRADFLACSTGTKRKWANHHHLINPKTGEPAQEVVATYIEGTSGILTDTYATTLSVMPWELACITLEKTPHIEGVLVRYDGTFYISSGSRAQLFT